jgi:hypothetical protein
MRPIYIDFVKLSFEKYPQVWTENIGMKTDNLYKKNKRNPTFFKKVLNVLIRDNPIKNVYLLTQHLANLLERLNDIDSFNDDDEEEDVTRQKELVNDVLLEDSLWNSVKQNFPTLNLEMINEFWYYFTKNENELKSYI